MISFQQLRESSGETVELSVCSHSGLITWDHQGTKISLCRVFPFPAWPCEAAAPCKEHLHCSPATESQENPRDPLTSLENTNCFCVCIAKLLLLWLLVVIYQLHPGPAADFHNYSGFAIWFHPHFISMLLQHALYMLYIPPECSVLYKEMTYPRSPRVCLKNCTIKFPHKISWFMLIALNTTSFHLMSELGSCLAFRKEGQKFL